MLKVSLWFSFICSALCITWTFSNFSMNILAWNHITIIQVQTNEGEEEVSLQDASDAPFTPDIDMSKSWVTVDTTAPSPSVQASKQVSRAFADIPAETKVAMGYSANDMVQECMWNGRSCSPRYQDNQLSCYQYLISWMTKPNGLNWIYNINFSFLRNLSSFHDPIYGNCFTFNKGENSTFLMSQKPGSFYGKTDHPSVVTLHSLFW